MPRASQYLRDKFADDGAAASFLTGMGWKLNRNWTWTPPHPKHPISQIEADAIDYLIDEWDFGGIAE